MGDDELLARLRDTFPVLDRWRDHLARSTVPSAGSELASLDARWRYVPASSVAALGLGSAREHLHAVRLLVEAGELFPSATSTLCRAALVGAAQATWLLSGDDHDTRLRRALSLALEDYRQHINAGDATIASGEHVQLNPKAVQELERLRRRRNEIGLVLAELGGPLKINLTDDVLPAAIMATPGDDEFHAGALLRWRSMSGAAHSLMWHHFGAAGTTAEDRDADGVSRVVAGGDIGSLVIDYFTAFRVAHAGWRMLAEQGNRPDLLGPVAP